MSKSGKNKKYFLGALGGVVLFFSLFIVCNWMWEKSSLNDSCMACHYHTDSDMAWKQSVHYNSKSGVKTDCAACHLPPKGTLDYTKAKIATGMKDVWSYLTKNKEDIDWDSKGELEYAQRLSTMNRAKLVTSIFIRKALPTKVLLHTFIMMTIRKSSTSSASVVTWMPDTIIRTISTRL